LKVIWEVFGWSKEDHRSVCVHIEGEKSMKAATSEVGFEHAHVSK